MGGTEIYGIPQENDLATQQGHCSCWPYSSCIQCLYVLSQIHNTNVRFFLCQLFSSWLYAAWSKIASPGATAREHVRILKRSKMGCGQGCFLSPMFSFQRDHHGKQMTV